MIIVMQELLEEMKKMNEKLDTLNSNLADIKSSIDDIRGYGEETFSITNIYEELTEIETDIVDLYNCIVE